MRLVVAGLSLSSSWGNGHATTYRALLGAMAAAGHEVLFLERDQPWYAAHRDCADPDFCDLRLYADLADLAAFEPEIRAADAVIVGSYVPDGVAVCRTVQRVARGVTAFYDIDTPVTLARLAAGDTAYLSAELIPGFDLYLSFTGGPTLRTLERRWGARRAVALYCSADPAQYRPLGLPRRWELGYLGTYSPDRQPALDALLLEPARRLPDRRFVVAGPLYPADIAWPANVERIEHLAPCDHAAFYSSLGWTLNITRADMRAAGYSPSVRLFEAACCATPILSDAWAGLETLFTPGEEIVVASAAADTVRVLAMAENHRRTIGLGGRERVLAAHTASRRAAELVDCLRSRAVAIA